MVLKIAMYMYNVDSIPPKSVYSRDWQTFNRYVKLICGETMLEIEHVLRMPPFVPDRKRLRWDESKFCVSMKVQTLQENDYFFHTQLPKAISTPISHTVCIVFISSNNP